MIRKLHVVGLLFSAVSGVEMKDLQRREQAHFLISQLQCEPALRLYLNLKCHTELNRGRCNNLVKSNISSILCCF